ncbi:MAG: dipeptidase [Corynebacterium sp.]|uniref:dipeptidase n=1 Tax=Corynebacterium sp. TaxID=1720 RepID=UPI0026DBF46C|nr:dipeptidase [Corynebacterium sp.]MDO5030567.1 dipeptidase [Corynebacterium sp.]
MSIINKELTDSLRDHISAQRDTIRTQLTKLVSYPSVHGTAETKQACIDAAQAVTDMYAELGIELEHHHTVDGSIALSGFVPGSSESAKTVLLYSHYDVQPAGDESAWTADPWTLDERDGRWYGRGTADCKGNVVMHLAALRALRDDAISDQVEMPNIKIIVEGSEERGSAGLNNLIATQPALFDADVILIADVGNAEVGQPTLVTTLRGTADVEVRVDALEGPVHSGMFGGAAPDALAALIRMLDSLRDENGFTSIDGLDCSQRWEGLEYDPETFRADAGVLDSVDLISDDNTSVSDLTWARPSVIVTGIDCPPATNAVNAIPATAKAHINFRIPGGVDPAEAQEALENHLRAHAPWGVKVTVERDELANPFRANVEGEVVQLVSDSLSAAYGKETATLGEGASIPLCATLLEAVPDADIALYGVEEPQARIHSADESVDPNEIRDIAIGEAIFLASINGI